MMRWIERRLRNPKKNLKIGDLAILLGKTFCLVGKIDKMLLAAELSRSACHIILIYPTRTSRRDEG